MLRFVLRRLLLVIPSLAGLLVMTFFLIRVVPAIRRRRWPARTPRRRRSREIRRQYGLDQPLYVQFAVYLTQVARLDFGESAYSRRPVALDIKQRLPATLELTVTALLLATLARHPARHHRRRLPQPLARHAAAHRLGRRASRIAAFWFAIELQLLFAMQLDWLPLRGRPEPGPHRARPR